MTQTATRRCLWTALALTGLLACSIGPRNLASADTPGKPWPEATAFFETRVRPVLADHCFKCHGETKQKGELRLDTRAGVMTGGERGPAIVPGQPDKSLLIKAIRHDDAEMKMPPSKRLTKAQIDDVSAWVKIGAPWPGSDVSHAPMTPRKPGTTVTNEDRKHWAFQPVNRPAVPAGAVTPIDAFLLRSMKAKGLTPAPPASKRELIRRVYFDLIGLPPTPEAVDAFIVDPAPDAYERLLDRLLARPQYGERWGRHWFDVVRFAQTHGYERDLEKPNAWRYRDYVIQAFNDDKPYDRFVIEQLAGDELDHVSDDTIIATAFYRLGVWDDEPDDARQAEYDNLDDILSTTAEAFLGLTLGCARCHDHKFDPVPQEDYYSMLAFMRNIKPIKLGKGNDNTLEQVALKSGGMTLAVQEDIAPRPNHVLFRGNASTPGKPVEPRFIQVLCPTNESAKPAPPGKTATTSGRRRQLAEWIIRRDHPLTARVLVNRLWQHHFGQGIVSTPNDFGRSGANPTHPALLDWLAADLVDGGWRLKPLHKKILLSDAYRQSSRVTNDKAALVDPDNTLLWRQNMRRLEAEAIRDALLAVAGRLNLKMGGRGIFPTLPAEVLSTQSVPGEGWSKSPPAEQARRSVYIFVKRTLGVPLLETFDFASPDKSIASRTTTTIAPQALILLNSSFTDEQAAAFAERLLKEVGTAPCKNVDRAFRLALGRSPTTQESKMALAYLGSAQEPIARPDSYRQALTGLCKLLLNLNEFVYVD